jgi:hypothetical protein
MFKKYGVLGLILVILVELNFIFKIEPFASWYFPIIWLGYILIIDSIVYKLKKNSLISNRPWQIFGMFILSALFWWFFELVNLSIKNWSYTGLGGFGGNSSMMTLFKNLSFSTVLPAFFETVELLRSIHLFDKVKLKKRHKITKKTIYIMWAFGILCFVLPVFLPQFAFPLVWGSFFFILDPINYLHKQPSIIQHLKDRKFTIPLTLFAAGLIMGFFWEFWNYWAIPKWTYSVPYVGFWKIFEMPLVGYLGYLPFAFELYAMYWFARSLFVHKEYLLVK